VEEVEGAEGSISPLVATAMDDGDGRNGRAAAEAIRVASESSGVREGMRLGLGWVGGSTQTRASWVSQLGGLGGLAGQMGQKAKRPGGPDGFILLSI
jgi:hypothetical protein